MDNTERSSGIEALQTQGLVDARPATSTSSSGAAWTSAFVYVQLARPDHWFKNVFMLLGVLLAVFYYPERFPSFRWLDLLIGLAATCLAASSNYVLNEVLDAPHDRCHPVKRHRPIPSGKVLLPLAYGEWLALAALSLWSAHWINAAFLWTVGALLIMGIVYNVRPLRSKELPYLDVLSESVNNPLRLLLGWFVVSAHTLPPVSLLAAYWMVGAFFMASKRFGEYRAIGDKRTAMEYRSSFRHYNEQTLLVSMFMHVAVAALFLGVFIIRYHLELILSVPLIAGFFGYYLHIAFKPNSAVQYPERLYREWGLMIYLVVCLIVFVGLMFVDIPILYDVFNIAPSHLPTLWRLYR
jgi:decaprenyl-phosphate phosphoribosyltransferase